MQTMMKLPVSMFGSLQVWNLDSVRSVLVVSIIPPLLIRYKPLDFRLDDATARAQHYTSSAIQFRSTV